MFARLIQDDLTAGPVQGGGSSSDSGRSCGGGGSKPTPALALDEGCGLWAAHLLSQLIVQLPVAAARQFAAAAVLLSKQPAGPGAGCCQPPPACLPARPPARSAARPPVGLSACPPARPPAATTR